MRRDTMVNLARVEESLFCNCASPERVSLTASSVEIGGRAFDNCSVLRPVWLGMPDQKEGKEAEVPEESPVYRSRPAGERGSLGRPDADKSTGRGTMRAVKNHPSQTFDEMNDTQI
jgi:hypothetical protein